MSGLEQAPLSSVITKHLNVTSGTSMITRAPWPNGQYYRLRKINIAHNDGSFLLSGVTWKFWDQDLSSSTTAAVGSGASPLLLVGQPLQISGIGLTTSGFVAFNVDRDFQTQARMPFYAGVTVLTNTASTINLELEIV